MTSARPRHRWIGRTIVCACALAAWASPSTAQVRGASAPDPTTLGIAQPFQAAPTQAAAMPVVGAAIVVGTTPTARAPQPSEVALARFADLLGSLTRSGAVQAGDLSSVRTSWSDEGVLRYLGAPAGHAFAPPERDANKPEIAAISFMRANKALFCSADASVDFQVRRVRTNDRRHYVRLEQTIAGVPVFGGEMVVQLTPQQDVEAVLGNIARSPATPGAAEARPNLDAAAAEATIRALATARGASSEFKVETPRLVWFVPAVMREPGDARLAWLSEVRDGGSATLNARWLLDATDGSLVREYTRVYEALSRQVRDMNSDTLNCPAAIVRIEGGPVSGVGDVDALYDMIGDADAFYRTQHGRDGINNAGLMNTITARACSRAISSACPWLLAKPQCPWPNAQYSGTQFWFGSGFAKDDIAAHEWTHGVTDFESDLIYANESGAINESLSDVWGEFVDLGNGRGNDSPGVRWILGEEMAAIYQRDMKNPPASGQGACPDRRNSPFYKTGPADNGGVHFNSGVNNKLCYLLTDGDTLSGQTVAALGITSVARLYYEAQTNLLTPSSGWTDLFLSLQQGAINLGWSDADQNNVYRACVGVEIAQPGGVLYVDGASTCPIELGYPNCIQPLGPYRTLGNAIAHARPGDTISIRTGNYPELITTGKLLYVATTGGVVTIGP